MKAKKTKLPEKLYHYTDPIKYRMILATGKLLLTPSNLKYDNVTLHDEPLFFNGQKIGYKSVDKYENYHPVVWLTANDHAGAKNTGLSNDKIMCRITIRTNGKIWRWARDICGCCGEGANFLAPCLSQKCAGGHEPCTEENYS